MAKAATMKTLNSGSGKGSTSPDYSINYDDKRFKKVETDKTAALNENNKMYDGMIDKSDAFFNDQIDAAKDWEQKQTEIQNEQTDFAIEKIEQQKEQANKDYIKEQSGAYTDWQKQSNQYGANAEQMAAQGMSNTGYSESAQVSMYNTYQQRVVAAREVFSRAVLDYDNAIKEARLQNSAALAQIAAESLQKRLELALQGFQYKNQLITDKANRALEIDNIYHSRWQDVLNQINTENALKETVRQHNQSYELQERAIALDEAQFAYQKQQDAAKATIGGGGGSGGGSGGSSGGKVKGAKAAGKDSSSIRGRGKTTSTKTGNTSTKTETKEPTVDMDSVLALGYGPISASKLSDLISKGVIKKYVEDGKIKFYKIAGAGGGAGSFKKPEKVNLRG